jgi:hypothetical protein
VKIDLGESVTVAHFAFYNSASLNGLDLKVYASSDDTATSYSVTPVTQALDTTTGWQYINASDTTKRYYVIQLEDTASFSNKKIEEILLANQYSFDLNFDLNNELGEVFGVDVKTSYGGIEYANKRHSPKTTWNWAWSNISASMKTSLESFRDDVDGPYKKFLYYDDTTYNWVRMSPDSLKFTEIAYNRYSTKIKLIEQLS